MIPEKKEENRIIIPLLNKEKGTKNNISQKESAVSQILERNKNLTTYTRSLLQKGFNMAPENSIEAIKVLDSNILLTAPPDFFDKYANLTKDLVIMIQNSISTNNKSSVISDLKKNPTDEKLKRRAFSIINAELINYDNSSRKDIEYNKFDSLDKKILSCLVINEIIGLGPLEPLFNDYNIREIMCNGPFDIQVEIEGTPKRVRSCKFRDRQHLTDLISRLYSSVDKQITRSTPIERARLHDYSRVFTTHESIAPEGPNFNIRRHTDQWTSPEQLLEWGMISKELLEWVGQMVYAGMSIAIIGSTGTGKTTFLNSIAGFIRPTSRIVTIEKNLELKLPPHKLTAKPQEAISPKPGSDFKGVSLRDLVEASTQQRPDVIILGEATGEEMFDIATALNSGHQGFSTLHADSCEETPKRMMTLMSQSELIKGKAAYELISTAFDLIIEIRKFQEDGSRWVTAIHEMGSSPELGENGELYLPTVPIWEFSPNKLSQELGAKITGTWSKVGEISDYRQRKHRLGINELPNLDSLMEIATPTPEELYWGGYYE